MESAMQWSLHGAIIPDLDLLAEVMLKFLIES